MCSFLKMYNGLACFLSNLLFFNEIIACRSRIIFGIVTMTEIETNRCNCESKRLIRTNQYYNWSLCVQYHIFYYNV